MERRRHYGQTRLKPNRNGETWGLSDLYETLLVLLILLMSTSPGLATTAHDNPMHIQFERSGGFAGMRLTAAIDSDTLSPDDAAALRDLIHTASFFDLPAKSQKSPSGADRFQYKVTVESADRRHTIEIDESAVPPSLRPLLTWLTEKAKSR
jgi:hypothetical protein